MPEQESKTYVAGAGKAILIDCKMQHSHLMNALGGPIPKKISMAEVHSILDIHSANGLWAQEVAQLYPHVKVIGIDEHAATLDYARRQAQINGVAERVSFQQASDTRDFDFFCFDLVHIHSTGTHMPAIDEMIRILRPGGWLNIVYYLPGLSSSDAFNTIERMGLRLLQMKHHPHSSEVQHVGIALRTYGMLLDASLLDVSYTIAAVDIGYNNSIGAREYVTTLLEAAAELKDQFVRFGFYEAEAYDELLARTRKELTDSYACGYTYLLSILGRKDW